MDTNNRWQNEQDGQPTLDTGYCRATLLAETRQSMVNKILRRHFPSSQEGLEELKKKAVQFEEKIWKAFQSDYQHGTRMFTMESNSRHTLPNALPQNAAGNSNRATDPGASLDSTAQTGHANGGDWQEEVYQKIKTMKDMYLSKLKDMYQKIATKIQQDDSLSQPPNTDLLAKLKVIRTIFELMISFLEVSKNNISPCHKDKLGVYEMEIKYFTNANKPRKPLSSVQQAQLSQSHIHQPQSQVSQVQSRENQMNPQMQSMNTQGSVPTMQQNNVSSLQQSMMNSLPASSNRDDGLRNAVKSLQQVKSTSPRAISAAVGDIGSVVSMTDRFAGSAPDQNGSGAAVGEDLVEMTNCRLQARTFITLCGTRKMSPCTSAMPLNIGSSASSIRDSLKQLNGPEASDLESTATSSVKRPRLE
ncbi:mediator of RNA polymerase II transcription subunit 15a-like isoform X3 [Mercurialis annua]|uniref:mediator of RNA polymerase II transcription subunit 15a-like isoform X3 n=1 Tax=Mercurialis annua TaxID=3986 RepID=UPI00215F4D2E|nr:mediator of RNA polymerase II transcription subunit 15a-like isoform X3 [Mercurialis annua]